MRIELSRVEHRLVGKSAVIAEVRARVDSAARSEAPVVIAGETGTGRELIAMAIHAASARAARSFVVIDARRFFADDGTARKAVMSFALGGSLFLRDFGALHPDLHAHAARSFGDDRDVRWLAAVGQSGRDRETMKLFRAEVITVSPLRERSEDISPLVDHLLEELDTRVAVSGDALRTLRAYDWPGNVDQLFGVLRGVVLKARNSRIDVGDLPAEIRGEGVVEIDAALSYKEILARARHRATAAYLPRLMRDHRGNVTRAAKRAGLERESLHRLLRRHGIHAEDYKAPKTEVNDE